MTDFQAWIPPAGEVVDPPVANWRKVDVLFSDRDEASGEAGDFNWSGEGDGPKIIAYSVVEEYVKKREPREWWALDVFGVVVNVDEQREVTENGAVHYRNAKLIRLREVLPEAPAKPALREVVAWAVVRGDGIAEVCFDEVDAVREARKGGTVRPLGFLP